MSPDLILMLLFQCYKLAKDVVIFLPKLMYWDKFEEYDASAICRMFDFCEMTVRCDPLHVHQAQYIRILLIESSYVHNSIDIFI
mgnify:CR=1 FL=1